MVAPDRRHHRVPVGIHDGHVQPLRHRHGEEVLVHQGPGGQAEGDIRHPQHGLQPQLLLHPLQGLQSLSGRRLLCRDGEGEAVDVDVFLPDPVVEGPVQDPTGDVYPVQSGLGNPPLVQGEAQHRRAVFLHDREDGVQALPVAVHRIDDRLAAVDPQGLLQHLGTGGVHLEGGVGHPLQGLHHLDHHLGLVDLGQAHVHVQDVRPGLGLLQGLGEHEVYVVPEQGLLHGLFAGGVDPLANHPHPVDGHGAHRAAHRGGHAPGDRLDGPALQSLAQPGDVLRRGAAAAAVALDPQLGQLRHGLGKLLRRDVVPRPARVRQAGVGLHREGQGGPPGQLLYQGGHLPGAQRAIDTNGVRPHTLQGEGGAGGGVA